MNKDNSTFGPAAVEGWPDATERTVFPSFLEALDEHLVAMEAEALDAADERYGEDESIPLDKLAKVVASESTIYRHLGGPPIATVTFGSEALTTESSHVDDDGQAHIVLAGTTPWAVLHQLAHILTPGEGCSRRWLDTYRDLVEERYGPYDAARFDFDTIKGWALEEHEEGLTQP